MLRGVTEQAQTGTYHFFDVSWAHFFPACMEKVAVQFLEPKPCGSSALLSQAGGGFCYGPPHLGEHFLAAGSILG